jgi:hypothetical protein
MLYRRIADAEVSPVVSSIRPLIPDSRPVDAWGSPPNGGQHPKKKEKRK